MSEEKVITPERIKELRRDAEMYGGRPHEIAVDVTLFLELLDEVERLQKVVDELEEKLLDAHYNTGY